MIVIRPVSYADILGAPNAAVLFAAYGIECSIPEIGEIDPQAALYSQMEQSGMFQAFGAFKGDELVGFAAVLVYVLPHYGRKIAAVESIFVAPEHRSKGTGNRLMNAIEEYAKSKGSVAILYSARAASTFERLLSLLSPYQRTNAVFIRSLR